MFNSKKIKALEARIANLEDVLTREVPEGETNHIGSELDGKVEQKEFEDFKKNVIGEEDCNRFWFTVGASPNTIHLKRNKTIFERIEEIKERFDKLEKYLGITRVVEDKKIDEYRKVSKKK